jgi:hypothetical protein
MFFSLRRAGFSGLDLVELEAARVVTNKAQCG